MFNAEEDDWMPTEEETTTPAIGDADEENGESSPTPFDEQNDEDDGTLPVEAPGGEPDVRERAVTIDGDVKTAPSLAKVTVLVKDPKKEGEGQLAYVTYNVKVTSKREGIEDGEVRRRYSDFEWLNKQLERENAMRIIPQIPGKMRSKQLSRFEDEFLERRRFLLNFFLTRISTNDVLSQSPCFVMFLTERDPTAWAAAKKNAEKKTAIQSAIDIVDTLRLKPTEERFQLIRIKLSDLMTQLQALEKNVDATRIHAMNVATEMNLTTPIFSEIGKVEPQLEKAMEALDKGVAMVVQEAVDKAEDESTRVIERLSEFHKLCEAVLALLTRRDLAEQAYDKASDDVNKKMAEKENVENGNGKSVLKIFSKKDPDVLKQEKLEHLEGQLTELKEKLDESEKLLKTWNYTVMQEVDQFEVIKIRDLKQIISLYTKINLNFHSRSKTAFEKAMPLVSAIALPGTQ